MRTGTGPIDSLGMGNRRSALVLALGIAICVLLGVFVAVPGDSPDAPAVGASAVPNGSSPPRRASPFPIPATAALARVPNRHGKSAEKAAAWTPWLRDALGLEGDGAGAEGVDGALMTNRDGDVSRGSANSADLNALAEIIAANGLHEGSSPFDYDDGDGVFDPWELGLQVWANGELVALSLGPDRSSTFGYGISRLPAAVQDLRALRYLDLHANALIEVPPELTDLSELRHLYLFRNRLPALPDRLGDLVALEVLIASQNHIKWLPRSIEDLANLEQLLLSDNPLEALPDGLGELRSLEVLDIARTREAGHDEGFHNLAEILASLVELVELHVTGPEVGALAPDRLRDASIARVYGWTGSGATRVRDR
jgi:hypothetical protein